MKNLMLAAIAALSLTAAVVSAANAASTVASSAGDAMAQPGDGTVPCFAEHRFEPGPIVNGHHRQPTPSEIEARTQQLQDFGNASAGSCLAVRRDRRAIVLNAPAA